MLSSYQRCLVVTKGIQRLFIKCCICFFLFRYKNMMGKIKSEIQDLLSFVSYQNNSQRNIERTWHKLCCKSATTMPSSFLKALDAIGNCQRTVFSLGVSQRMLKITNLRWKVWLNWSSKLQENNERKTHYFVCFQMPNKRLHLTYFIIGVRSYLFLKTMLLQVSFNANNYFELLPMSSAINWRLQL